MLLRQEHRRHPVRQVEPAAAGAERVAEPELEVPRRAGEDLCSGRGRIPVVEGPLGAPGCSLGTSADAILVATGANPSISVALPNIVQTAYVQWAVIDPAANSLGIVFSETRRVVIR